MTMVESVWERIRQDVRFREQVLAAPLAALQGYDLTDEERLSLVLPNFSWLLEGQLAGASRPHSADALALLTGRGVRAVVSLSEQPLAPDLLGPSGLEAVHLPLADFTAPAPEQAARAVAAISGFLAQEKPVVVHCAAGLGRTGTILACYLVAQGATAPQAIAVVRARRPGSVETPAQEAAVGLYERNLAPRGRPF